MTGIPSEMFSYFYYCYDSPTSHNHHMTVEAKSCIEQDAGVEVRDPPMVLALLVAHYHVFMM